MTAILNCFVAIADAIALLARPHVEVVIHDLASNTVFHVAGGFSNRKVGLSSLTELEGIGSLDGDVLGPYPKTNRDGRSLKSITAVLRDEAGEPVGLLCINVDVSALARLAAEIEAFLPQTELHRQPSALFDSDWREAVNTIVGEFCRERQTAPGRLLPPERDALLAQLGDRGIFSVRNAVPYVADVLQVSRATLYNSLKRRGVGGPVILSDQSAATPPSA